VLADVRSKAQAASESLDEADSMVKRASDRADDLEQSAAGHGWVGVAEAMASAKETLDVVAYTIADAVQATSDGLARLSTVVDELSSDEIAVRLDEARRLFASGESEAGGAVETLDDARSSAERADAETVLEPIASAAESLNIAREALTAALKDAESEHAQAAGWGRATGAGSAAAVDDDLTEPSREPDPQAMPEGAPERATRAAAFVQEALDYQHRAAITLARAGYRVRQLPRKDGSPSPDFEIESRIFDCYTPSEGTPADGVRTKLRRKSRHQASRFVLNLDRSGLDADQIRRRLVAMPPRGVREVLVVRNDSVSRIWP
jgi:hypothetical protein